MMKPEITKNTSTPRNPYSPVRAVAADKPLLPVM
jgi:hypothetical protein